MADLYYSLRKEVDKRNKELRKIFQKKEPA